MRNHKEDYSFLSLLKDCAKKKDLYNGAKLHADILKRGLLGNSPHVGSILISMYAKCGQVTKAQEVLDNLPVRDVVAWNALISGYAQYGQGHEALSCFELMQSEGLSPVAVTFVCILKACATMGNIDKGEEIHEEIVKRGLLQNDIVVGNALVNMYLKCGILEKAKEVLEKLPMRDVVSWNALISGYAQEGLNDEALNIFERMQNEGISPDAVTFNCILKVCGKTKSIEKAKQIHEKIVSRDLLEKNVILGNALVDTYAKCGMFTMARQFLESIPHRNAASWNALIAGYTQKGLGVEALYCFEQMQSEGFLADVVTFLCILKACGSAGAVEKGKQIHNEILSRRLMEKDIILGTALVDMYAKCGVLPKAQEVLEGLSVRDRISWNALITGYAQQEQDEEALNCFEQMQREGLSPDVVTFICILKVCGNTGAIDKGRQIHEEILNQGILAKDIVLGTALIDMYAKCGMLEKAQQVLEGLPERNVVSWNALIAGYAQQGNGREALRCFYLMQSENLCPDDATFLCVLSACSHSGLLEDAEIIFNNMTLKYGITPNLEHHTCMVAIFGFSGNFGKAMSVLKVMPSCDDPAVWLGLLGACRKWGNVKLGKLFFNQAVQLDVSCGPAYILMASIFAAAGMQEDARMVEAMRLKYAAQKKGNKMQIDGAGKNVHSVFVKDVTYAKLESIAFKISQEVYFSNVG